MLQHEAGDDRFRDASFGMSSGFDTERLNSRLTEFGFESHFAPVIGSTMGIASWLEGNGISPRAGQLLVAGAQPAGVGHSGAWLSHELDLKFTLLAPEVASVAEAQQLRMAVAVSVVEALREVSANDALPAFVKWPNDVRTLRGGEYRKIAGILVHTRQDSVLCDQLSQRGFVLPEGCCSIGVGVGLVPPDGAARVMHYGKELALSEVASSLYCLSKTIFSRERVLEAILRHLHRYRSAAPQQSTDRFLQLLGTDSEGTVRAYFEGNALPPGVADALSPDGSARCKILDIQPESVSVEVGGRAWVLPYRALKRTHPWGALDL